MYRVENTDVSSLFGGLDRSRQAAGFDAAAGDGPRLAAACEAAIRSFFNRLGRMPTAADLRDLVPQFLSNGVAGMPTYAGESSGRQMESQSEGTTDVDSVVRSFFDRHGRLPARFELRALLGGIEPPGHWPDLPISPETLTIERPRTVNPPPSERGEFPERTPDFYERYIQPLVMPLHLRLFPFRPEPTPRWTHQGIKG